MDVGWCGTRGGVDPEVVGSMGGWMSRGWCGLGGGGVQGWWVQG